MKLNIFLSALGCITVSRSLHMEKISREGSFLREKQELEEKYIAEMQLLEKRLKEEIRREKQNHMLSLNQLKKLTSQELEEKGIEYL